MIAASVTYLDDAVELALTGHAPARLVVFDYHPEVDDQRETFDAARSRLAQAGSPVSVETLADVLDRGKALPAAPVFVADEDDPLTLLIYTSGSTGAPKGAMQPERLVANFWRKQAAWGQPHSAEPWITLSFMPMSHLMGRGSLYGTLGNGGTAYFAAKSDLSTFLDDLALVRPTRLDFVPRIWDMLFGEFQSELDRRSFSGADRAALEATVMAEQRQRLLGGRFVSATDGLRADLGRDEGIRRVLPRPTPGGTLRLRPRPGPSSVDGQVLRPQVIDYKLADVPDLGYFGTDQPHPRGELLVKTDALFPGYYKRPEVTAEVFDPDGYYRTGDIMAEVGPDQLAYLDRRNNVQKLSQGEFVTVSKLEAVFGDSPLVGQIYVYGNSARAYLLAVVVPTADALSRSGGDIGSLKPLISESLQNVAKSAGLQSYEIPRDFIVETTPFTLENGLLTGIRKLARPKLKVHYGDRLEQLYAELAEGQANELRALRHSGADRPVLQTISRAAGALLGAATTELAPDAHFNDLGGDSLSALTFANLLQRDLRRRRAGGRHREPGHRPAGHRRLHRGRADIRCEAAHLCGGARPRRHRGARP